MATKTNLGENIKSLREIKGMKQEMLAELMGDDWTQKKISLLEEKEDIDQETLQQVAKALEVPVESIKNYNKEAVVNFITKTFHDHSSNHGGGSGSVNY